MNLKQKVSTEQKKTFALRGHYHQENERFFFFFFNIDKADIPLRGPGE